MVSTYFGNIAFAYEDYGLPYCFMASLFNTGINEPNDYSEETIARISKDGEITRNESDEPEEDLPNILFVQLESYFDVEEAEFFTTSKDACPNLHEMYDKYSSGYFKVPSVGAGTANTEFEVLTGMNLRYFGPGEYPYKTILKETPCESAATALESLGYGTHALHNNGGNFYSRARVFNNMGFDSFTSKEFMNILQLTENGWSKDDILIDHIVDALDSTEQQDFVFTISVQGHGDYPEEKVIENPEITVEGIEDEALKNKWEYYVNQVYEMDKFAGDLVNAIEKRGEPTVVVFYGDHLPTMGLKAEDLKGRYLYNTNYVIWDNIGLEKEDRNIPSYQIMADVFDRLGIHSGTVFNYHQERRQTKNYLADLELLQYDILVRRPVCVRRQSADHRRPYGDGCPGCIADGHRTPSGRRGTACTARISPPTPGSMSTGRSRRRNFLNNTRIDLPSTELKDGDVIYTCQYGSSDTLFRKADDYIYQDGKLTEAEGTGTDKTRSWVEQTGEEE